MKQISSLFMIALALIFGMFFSFAVVVDETEQVVITRFREVVGDPITRPGLQLQIPYFRQLNVFPKNIQAWDGEPGEIITNDKTYIWVDTFARWRIIDPIAFIKIVTDMESARSRLSEIINPAVRDAITSHKLIETVRNSNRKMTTLDLTDMVDDAGAVPSVYTVQTGRAELTREIIKASRPKLEQLGIELLDVKIKRINYVQKVRDSVYNRMIAERKQMAEKIRSEGQGEAQRIAGDKERDLRGIQSEAYRTAQETKGKADAEATRIYAEAYTMDPEYYSFTKSLDVYKNSLSEKSKLVISMDSEFMKYMKGFSHETAK
ncbi:MAG: protease modulator HflC [Desulfobacterales bacterium]|jgi:membrane protease subunit HflC|nr:protease modulator HflC [Desulfobacterales bacterium]